MFAPTSRPLGRNRQKPLRLNKERMNSRGGGWSGSSGIRDESRRPFDGTSELRHLRAEVDVPG
jgi:hypothetical protein